MSHTLQQAHQVVSSIYDGLKAAHASGELTEGQMGAINALLPWVKTQMGLQLVDEEGHDHPWVSPLAGDADLASLDLANEGIGLVDHHTGRWIVLSRNVGALCWLQGEVESDGWSSGSINLNESSTPEQIRLQTITMGEIFEAYASFQQIHYSDDDYWVAYAVQRLFVA